MNATTQSVLQREARFGWGGERLPDSLHDTDQAITAGLVQRLRRYAEHELSSTGFIVADWSCEVYTMDADCLPSDRMYTVEFTNTQGGRIGVQGILTAHGWPVLDHGLCVGADR